MDRTLSISLMALFGLSGMALLVLAGLRVMPASERFLNLFAGFGGVAVALVQGLRSFRFGKEAEPQPVNIKEE